MFDIVSAHLHRHDDFFQPLVSSAEQHMYVSNSNERITLRLHAPWKGRTRATQGVMKARESIVADRDRLRPSTGATA